MQTEKLKVAYQNKHKITELWVGGKEKKRKKKEDICELFFFLKLQNSEFI